MPDPDALLPRVGEALAANGLAVTAATEEMVLCDGLRTVVRATATVTSVEGASATFAGLGGSHGPNALGEAVLQALSVLWLGALLLDVRPLPAAPPDPPDASIYLRDASVREAHLRDCRHAEHIRNSWRKHRAEFAAGNVLHARRGAVVDALANWKGARGEPVTLAKLNAYLDEEPAAKPAREKGAGA
jgi:hypothetical protein